MSADETPVEISGEVCQRKGENSVYIVSFAGGGICETQTCVLVKLS